MASLELIGGNKKYKWEISNLGNPFNTTYYISAGVCTSPFLDGASSVVNPYTINAPTSGSSRTVTSPVITGIAAATYTLYGFARAANGYYYNAGYDTMVVTNSDPSTTRSFTLSGTTLFFKCTFIYPSDNYTRLYYTYRMTIRNPNGTLLTDSGIINGLESQRTITATATIAGTYTALIQIYWKGDSTTVHDITTNFVYSPRPPEWSWNSSELSAFNNHGPIATVLYTRWNDFIENIRLVVRWSTGSTSTTYETWLNNGKMTSSNKTLTAVKFNYIKNTIGSFNSTNIQNVNPGDQVLGEYFIIMTEKLNNI